MFLRFPKLSDLLLKRLKVEIFPFGSMVFVLYKNLRYKLKTTVDPTRLIGVDRSLDDALSNRRFLPSFHILLSCFFFLLYRVLRLFYLNREIGAPTASVDTPRRIRLIFYKNIQLSKCRVKRIKSNNKNGSSTVLRRLRA